MAGKNLIRKSHRYLGLFIGIQFLAWTISGMFFAWNDIDSVHGDPMRKAPKFLSASNTDVVSPGVVVQNLVSTKKVDSIHSVNLISIGGKPTYQISYFAGHSGEGSHHHVHYALADVSTGKLREPLSKEEAVAVAKDNVVAGANVVGVDYLEKVDGHHEFRERPLPAWAVRFDNPKCTAYVSTELGTFQTLRNDQWRAFDFLWMFHTMDYETRDDINNWPLRILSIFGLVTVLSGFILFVVTSRTVKKITV